MDEEPIDDDFDESEEEFSLDQLSRAYAEVMRENDAAADGLSEDVAADSETTSEDNPTQHNASTENAASSVARPTAVQQQTEVDLAEDQADNAGCQISPESIIESILFVGAPRGTRLTREAIADVMRDVSAEEIDQYVESLNDSYQKQDAAFRIIDDDGNLQMTLVEGLSAFQDDYYGRNKQVQLSQPVIDVLAVVAYNQPIAKDQVESLRGQSSGAILAQLVRRNLLRIEVTDSKPVKRHYLTTDRFLELFHLKEINDLPQSHDVSEYEDYIE